MISTNKILRVTGGGYFIETSKLKILIFYNLIANDYRL